MLQKPRNSRTILFPIIVFGLFFLFGFHEPQMQVFGAPMGTTLDFSSAEVILPGVLTTGNFTLSNQTDFWKISINETSRIIVNVSESDSGVLDNGTLKMFLEDNSSLGFQILQGDLGEGKMVASVEASESLFLVLSNNNTTSFGNYSLIYFSEKYGYSLDSALEINSEETKNDSVFHKLIEHTRYWNTTLNDGQEAHFEVKINSQEISENPRIIAQGPTGKDLQITFDSPGGLSGRFTPNTDGTHYIIVEFNASSVPVNYSLTLLAPSSNYNFESAEELQTRETRTDSIEYPEQMKFWKVDLKENQRAFILLNETSSNVLEGAELVPWDNPESDKIPKAEEGGIINHTINFELGGFRYFQLKTSDAGELGNFTILFSVVEEGYSFYSAIPLSINTTTISKMVYPDSYYWAINLTENTQISFSFRELFAFPNVLEDATMTVYDPGRSIPLIPSIWERFVADGKFEGEFNTTINGTYYFIIEHVYEALSGPIEIRVIGFAIKTQIDITNTTTGLTGPETTTTGLSSTSSTSPFVELPWNQGFSALSLLLVSFLFITLFVIERRGILALGEKWNLEIPRKECFYYFSSKDDLDISKSNPFSDLVLNFVGSTGTVSARMGFKEFTPEGTEHIEGTRITTSRKRGKIDFLLLISLAAFFYGIVNFIAWAAFNTNFLPEELLSLDFFLAYFFLAAIPLFLYYIGVWNQIMSYNDFINSVNDGIVDLQQKSSTLEKTTVRQKPEARIHHARRAWTQAKTAFKEEKLDLFVIKADTAIRHAMEARYNQVFKHPAKDIEFPVLAESLRDSNFDIPRRAQIDYFRKLRNSIAHGSGKLNPKDAPDALEFFSKFYERLGLSS